MKMRRNSQSNLIPVEAQIIKLPHLTPLPYFTQQAVITLLLVPLPLKQIIQVHSLQWVVNSRQLKQPVYPQFLFLPLFPPLIPDPLPRIKAGPYALFPALLFGTVGQVFEAVYYFETGKAGQLGYLVQARVDVHAKSVFLQTVLHTQIRYAFGEVLVFRDQGAFITGESIHRHIHLWKGVSSGGFLKKGESLSMVSAILGSMGFLLLEYSLIIKQPLNQTVMVI
ncbi:hypothetical protein FGO68_gene14741 [Halteria grandinella]|uniref:Uncharacterized protein n=1 Tax=Halteria grandinella TaxID=5974 RepID=A0A8J8T0Z6_HALGN|nr:hypothetical protein FGO68_gene14741 [Halteria grandinella]